MKKIWLLASTLALLPASLLFGQSRLSDATLEQLLNTQVTSVSKKDQALARAAVGFSGSEIEQAIVSAMYTAHAQGRALAQDDLLAETRQTRPLSVVMAEKVDEIRDWAKDRTVPCD